MKRKYLILLTSNTTNTTFKATNTTLNAEINEVKNEIPNITNLASNVSLNAKTNEIKDEIPSITNLAETAALTTVENKIPNASDLVKKADYDSEIKLIKSKYSPHLIIISSQIIYLMKKYQQKS